MFIKSYMDFNNDTYIIEDTDFVERTTGVIVSGWEIIVSVYEKRNLNVVKNLILAMNQFNIIHVFNNMDIFNPINDHEKEYYSKYNKYKEKVEKYLMLV